MNLELSVLFFGDSNKLRCMGGVLLGQDSKKFGGRGTWRLNGRDKAKLGYEQAELQRVWMLERSEYFLGVTMLEG